MATLQLPARRYQNQSTGWLLSTVAQDTRELVSDEVAAAKIEIRQQLNVAKTAAVSAAIGGGVLAIGAIVLAMAAAQLLALTALPLWAASAIVGGALVVIGGILLAFGGQRAADVRPMPARTMREAKKDIQWIKNEVTSERT